MKMISIVFAVMIVMPSWGQNIAINESQPVSDLMDKYVVENKSRTEIQGYRIQIVATTDRRLMESTRTKFMRAFPLIKSKWVHSSPYYQVQAGAYATKHEVLPELGKIKKKFPKAYPIVDKISKEEVMDTL